MEMWRRVWREGLASRLSTQALTALRHALEHDEPRLVQGATCSPPAWPEFAERRVETACALGYCGWQGHGLSHVGALEAYFAERCRTADQLVGVEAASRFFLNWYDDTPREAMRTALLAEVELVLRCRPLAA